MLRAEFQKLWRSKNFWIALTVSLLIGFLPFLFMNSHQSGQVIYTPENSCLLYGSGLGALLLFFFTPLLASFPYASSYHEEKRNHSEALLLTRKSRQAFFLSKLTVILVSAFIISVVPFLFNYLLCLVAFPRPNVPPVDALPFVFKDVYTRDFFSEIGQVLFPRLFLNYPILDVLLHLFLVGVWGMGCAALTFSFSLVYHRHLLVTAFLPSILVLISIVLLDSLFGSRWIVPMQLMLAPHSGINASTPFVVCLLLLVPFLIGALFLSYRLYTPRGRDEL